MKRILALLLVFVVVSQSLMNVALAVYYTLNKAYITQQLCENRNDPSLKCNGKCYLSKQLKKAEESERKSAALLKDKIEIISIIPSIVIPCFHPDVESQKGLLAYSLKVTSENHALAIIHPPEMA